MSINGALLGSDGTPQLIMGEKMFFNQGGVKLEFESGNGYPGQLGASFFSKSGSLYLTNRRIIYVAQPALPQLQTLNIPIANFRDGKLVQPWFGENRYEATVVPVPNGGLHLPGACKFGFKEGGGFEFTTYLKQLISRITGEPTEECLPEYAPPVNTGVGSSSTSPPPPPPLEQHALQSADTADSQAADAPPKYDAGLI